jgi:hypothetical protein
MMSDGKKIRIAFQVWAHEITSVPIVQNFLAQCGHKFTTEEIKENIDQWSQNGQEQIQKYVQKRIEDLMKYWIEV